MGASCVTITTVVAAAGAFAPLFILYKLYNNGTNNSCYNKRNDYSADICFNKCQHIKTSIISYFLLVRFLPLILNHYLLCMA